MTVAMLQHMPLTLSFESWQDLEFLKGELQSKVMIQERKTLEYTLQESCPSLFFCTRELILAYHLYKIQISHSSLYFTPRTVFGTYKVMNYILN